MSAFQRIYGEPAPSGKADSTVSAIHKGGRGAGWLAWPTGALALAVVLVVAALPAEAQNAAAEYVVKASPQRVNLPPRVTQAQRFLAQRGLAGSQTGRRTMVQRLNWRTSTAIPQASTPATATWQSIGPAAVVTPEFGLVTGRISALALDPSDSTGDRLYLGTTGGGVWEAQNAGVSDPSLVVFTPLTDAVGALSGATDASISIGALTVQPGGTGVILAGTGDPNDALDSYYGAGILRSTDGGNTWSLIHATADQKWSFAGEGFAGFAWSTANPQLVVAAVSQAYEGTLVNAPQPGRSYQGLYYSSDGGATWNLATITDGNSADVQGPNDTFAGVDGNAATSVVWNPVRQLFVAAVRYHGYYQSADGITWTRMAAQPGSGLTATFCPTNVGSIGSIDCPIFRGTLAVNPLTGDTFAWTVNAYYQDQGLWQDQCAKSGNACASQTIAFARRWSTTALETSTIDGAATIENGDYNLSLAAVPSGQDTLLLAGANDLWKCSLAMGCAWRNTTNSTVGFCAQVAPYQHALAWNAANPLEIFIGNDSGLWRSIDAIGETGQVCASTDSTHFQNLNGSLGSLAEVVSVSPAGNTPYTMMTGLGVNGTAGVKSVTGTTAEWPQILGGEGGPVAIDPQTPTNWYVNNQEGVSIHLCAQSGSCTPTAFGATPVVSDANVGGDGLNMTAPAPFLVDPQNPTQLLIGTCRVWRGPANGIGWNGSNAISPILDNPTASGPCSGDALIRTIAAIALPVSTALPSGGEVVFVGMYGAADGGANLAGHVLTATFNASSGAWSTWHDLTLNPVSNDTHTLNAYGYDVSSIFIDSHDTTGKTVYVTVEGIETTIKPVRAVYRSTDGGAHWADLTSNLPIAPASSLAVDPQDANTVYLATDVGVYFTTQVTSCTNSPATCWSAFGTGLPKAPVVQLSTSPLTAPTHLLIAATYGRGVWQTPLWTSQTGLTTAIASPSPLAFANSVPVNTSSMLTITLLNTGSLALALTSTGTAISGVNSGDFNVTTGSNTQPVDCHGATVQPGSSCTIQVTFAPTATGSRAAELTIYANVYGGQLPVVELSGTASPAPAVTLTPPTLSFGQPPGQVTATGPVVLNTTSAPQQVEAGNSSSLAVTIASVNVSTPFTIASNSCGTSTLQPQHDCQVMVAFAPTQRGAVAGTLTFTDGAGTQTVALSGWGSAPPTDILNPISLTFPGTIIGQPSTAQTVSLANTGDLPLTGITFTVSGPFTEFDNCNGQLAASSSCSINVQFIPTAAGTQTGWLIVTDALQTQTVALSGTGLLLPVFSVSPASLNFGAQPPGVASPPLKLTMTNNGGAPMANVGFQITGAAASSFAWSASTCGTTLNNGSGCTVQVIFTPATSASSSATLTVSSSTRGVAPVLVPLNGNGAATTVLSVSPSQLTYAATVTGQSSAAQTVTVTNAGSFAAISLTLTVVAPFSLTQDTCSGYSLAAGASCTAGVIFTPTTSGTAPGTLTVGSTSAIAPTTVTLSGTGVVPVDFTVTISGSNSQTVANGQTAYFPLVITPAKGLSGTFTLQSGTLPANTLCLFNPGSVIQISAGAAGNVTAQISTGKSGSAVRSEGPAKWRVLPLACGLVLLPLAWRRRRKFLLMAALLAVIAGGVSSCTSSGGGSSGGSGSQGGSGSTPAGTYLIPLTVVSGTIQHSVTVTLTVD